MRINAFTKIQYGWLVVFALVLCTVSVNAQITPYTFLLDESMSGLQVRGDVLGFKLIGDRQAAFGGEMNMRLGNRIVPFRGFKIDDSLLIQLDPMNADLKNPIPGLPPVGWIHIDGITVRFTSGIVRTNAQGQFSDRKGTLEVLSGTMSGEVLGVSIDPVDLAGTSQSGLPMQGTLYQVDDIIYFDMPLSLKINNPDYNLTFTGGYYATAPVQ